MARVGLLGQRKIVNMSEHIYYKVHGLGLDELGSILCNGIRFLFGMKLTNPLNNR